MISPVIVERYKQIIDDLETDPYQKLSHLKWMLGQPPTLKGASLPNRMVLLGLYLTCS